MISVDGLTVEFGGTTLFSDISFQINEKDRIALMGKNGAGKSTLLKILAGVRQPTRGKVTAPKDCVVAYLPQHLMTEDGRTVFEEASQAFAHLRKMEEEIERMNNELATRTDYESDSYMELIEKVAAMSEKFYAIDMTHFEEDVEKALLGLGFMREDFNRPTSDFSGGWRMRIELAKLLLQNPDVLLLDEPTNHLDIESIGWLEEFLINSAKAVVVISHDRKFVDNITTRTIEVTMGRIYDYKVNYSQYLVLRKERREQQMKQYEEQQKMIQETKDFIERFKGTYSKTLQVQSRVKMLEKLELIEVDEEDTSALRLKFPPSPRSGSYPVIMEGVGKTYGDHVVFRNAKLTKERGDKVAFVGKNGEGKSTLVKCIMGEIEHEGTLTLGHNVQIGYFAQNQASLLDENLTVFQTIDDVAKGEIRNKIRDLLGAFMFGGPEESMKKVTDRIIELGDRKEQVTQEDLPYIISDVLKHDTAENKVKLLSYFVTLAKGLKPMATLSIEINGKVYQESSSGDGQYDAFVRALRKIYKGTLERTFPMLVNYAVTIPPGGRTDAFVQTVITWNYGDREFRTRGFDADQTEAAIKATLKMLNKIEQ